MSQTTNYKWRLPDWEISSGQNAALEAIDGSLYSLSNTVSDSLVVSTTTLVAGTKAVANTAVTSSTKVLFCRATLGGTPGHLSYTVSAGVGITFNSSSSSDTSSINYVIR